MNETDLIRLYLHVGAKCARNNIEFKLDELHNQFVIAFHNELTVRFLSLSECNSYLNGYILGANVDE